MVGNKPTEGSIPLEVQVDDTSMTIRMNYKSEDPPVILKDQFSVDLARYDLQRRSGENPVDYITRVRETLVAYTPNADTTPETLR